MSTATTAPASFSRDAALIAAFAALIAAFGLVPGIQLGFGVPITLQLIPIMLAGAVLGPRRGLLAVLVFLVLVAIGLPLLPNGRGGLGVFVGKSAGYLISWPLVAAVIGALTLRWAPRPGAVHIGLACVAGIVVCHLLGIAGMALVGRMPWGGAAVADLSFVPGDLLKAVVVAVVAAAVHTARPGLLTR